MSIQFTYQGLNLFLYQLRIRRRTNVTRNNVLHSVKKKKEERKNHGHIGLLKRYNVIL